MSNIVLSASVRQNLLSLQSTADLLATTQNRLATGNKVNTALDNPTNYFTAQSLNNRASDISNLLDGIGNGVQVLQAANTGITSLQSLVDSAKSVANQALQAAVGYSAKSSVSTTIAGATADNLLGTTTAAASSSFDAGAFTSIDVSNTGAAAAGGVINAGSFSSVNVSGTGSSATASAVTAGAFSAINVSSTGSPATSSAVTAGAFSSINVSGTGSSASTAATYTAGSFGSNLDLSSGSISFTLDVDGTSQSITLDSSAVTTFNSNTSGSLTASSLSAQDVADLVNYQLAGSSGATVPTTPVTVTGGGDLQIASSASAGTGSVVKITGYSATGVTDTTGLANVDNEGSNLVPAASEKFDLTVGGNTTHVDISKAAVDAYNADSANSSALISSASSLSVDDVVKLVNYQVGSTVASNASGALKFTATTSGSGQTVTTSAVTTAGTATGSTGVVSDSDSSGANLVAAASEKFDLTIDSNTTHVDISKAAVDAYNADSANSSALISSASSLSVDDVVKLVNYQVGSTVASNASGALKFSATAGASHTVTTSVVTTAGSATGSTGVVSNSDSSGAAGTSADALNFSVTVDGTAHSVSISAATLATYNGDSANSASLITDTAASLSAADVAKLVNYQVGSTVASVDSTTHNLDFTSAAGSTHSIATSAVTTAGAASNTTGIASHASVAGTPAGTAGALNFSVTVDGTAHSVSLSAAALTTYNADSANSAAQITDTAASLSVDDVAKLINYQVGSTVASNDSGVLKFTSGTGSTHSVAVSAVTTAGTVTGSTGITAHAAATGTDATGGLSGLTLTIGATGGGTATSITFGSSSGQVKSLNDLNNALSANNLLATIDSSGKLSITTTNDAASATIGAIGGSATTTTGSAFNGIAAASAPVQDAAAQLVRSNLVNQYNNILDQITTTAQDASYNGIDLLNGDQLKLTFNETGTSTLKIQGVSFNSQGLGLSKLVAGSDFLDNASANSAIKSLDNASSSLRTEASALGSNLSIVQIRQDFSKNLINVLQTGSSNLTLADTNEEAANSQALSTRQSIAVSALSLANQSQQSVLQLLR